MKQIILTGDRPTGRLHVGHYVGSLSERVRLQNSGEFDEIYIMIADAQALTDNAEHPEKVRQNIMEVALDYLACGLDPEKVNIFIQSMDDLFYEPPQKTPVSSAKPVMPSESTTKEADSNPQTVQTSSPEAEPQQETPTKRSIWDSKWWKNKWDYGFAVSAAVSLFFLIVEEIFQTEAGETVATATGAVFLVFLVIEVVRLVMWILNPPPPPGF